IAGTKAAPSLQGRPAHLGNAKRPMLKPNTPLVLAKGVGAGRRELGEATCTTEMSLMMEIEDFTSRASKAEAERKQKAKQEYLGSSGNLTPKQTNKLLSRFPNISYII
uniref:Uncharacterized protein n=1 Tax=Monodelphis domestica TaxID=13616 RepID=A0A5F8GS45_MONDO